LLQIVNSVVMNLVVEDGCHIQGSVVCNNVQLQERAVIERLPGTLSYTPCSNKMHAQ
jgi:hypothetical protein